MTPVIDIWFFVTLVLVALLMGTSFAHTLEMIAKLHYTAQQWLYLQQTLYQSFATIGGTIEVAAVLAALVLAYLVRGYRRSFRLVVTGVICLVIALLGIWLLVTNSVNIEVRRWTADTIPSDWTQWRSRWEYSHLARFMLHLIAFCAVTGAFTLRPPAIREP